MAQIAVLHPNIWLSYAAKMSPQVCGLLQPDPFMAAKEQCDMGLTQSVGLKAISYLLVSFT